MHYPAFGDRLNGQKYSHHLALQCIVDEMRKKEGVINRCWGLGTGDWGPGTGDWGLETGDWGLGMGDGGWGLRDNGEARKVKRERCSLAEVSQ